jgi:hypothetical protein
VISRAHAATIVESYLNRRDPYRSARLRFVVTQVDERPGSWAVYYDSLAHLNSGRAADALTATGPVLVSKRSGAVAAANAARSLPERIAEAERRLADMEGTGHADLR